MTLYSSSSRTSLGSARVSSPTSSRLKTAPPPVTAPPGALGVKRGPPARARHARPPPAPPLARLGLGDRHRGLGVQPPGRELLADHAQRQGLVARRAQEGPRARDVGRRLQPVAARRAPGLEQLLVLEVADLGDRDVGELGA